MVHCIYGGVAGQILKIFFVIKNSLDPDKMSGYLAFHLGPLFAKVLIQNDTSTHRNINIH